MITEARSSTAQENIQEVLDAEDSASYATLAGQQQYETPAWLVEQCEARLPSQSPDSVIDPQCATGGLIRLGGYRTVRFGCDIDNRLEGISNAHLITGNCVKVFEAIDDIFPDLRWQCGNANPPFGKRWKTKTGVVDSTKLTWEWLTRHANYGYFIANAKTIKELAIDKHPWATHYEEHDGTSIWKGMKDTLRIGIVWWQRPYEAGTQWSNNRWSSTEAYKLVEAWKRVQAIVDEEKVKRPKFNIYLDHKNILKTYLSVRSEVKLKLKREDILKLHKINNCHPLSLTPEKETRNLMRDLIACGVYVIQPEAKAAIEQALKDVNALACPIMHPTEFERVAYLDEEEVVECICDVDMDEMHFTKGKTYPLSTGSYRFTDKFTRNKVHFDDQTLTTYTKQHDCTLSGVDRYIQVTDDYRRPKRFQDRPKVKGFEFEESLLWKFFKKPEVKTVLEALPDFVKQNAAVMRSCEMLSGFSYYPGQLSYLSRVATKDAALVAAATGTGKSLFAITMLALKCPERALIIAPQGTMKSSSDAVDDDEEQEEYNAAQWIQEIQKFAPYLTVYELFSYGDYQRICSMNGGTLPPGVYVSYPEAMFRNGARETAPQSWNDIKLNKWAKSEGYAELPEPTSVENDESPTTESGPLKRFWCDTIGQEHDGIRCIISPCLATKIGHLFDAVLLDESHLVANLGSTVTNMLIRLQPKYRYAFSATPIPNIVSNLFPIMGWLCVPDWYRGGRRNAAFPYAREDLGRFNNTFLTVERDHTQEEMNRSKDPNWKGTCTKGSPVIAAPSRLLKIVKPTIAYVGKEDLSDAYIPPELIDVRVPMGREQAQLYAYYLDRANIPASHPLVRARKQTAWLRGICADPAGFSHCGPSTPKCSSNFNPKVITLLELVRDILAQGEQFLIINSRVGLSNAIQDRLIDAGVSISRIDSTIPAEQHARQAGLFKSRKSQVHLLGIKCASSYSFDDCNYAAIGSIEWTWGAKCQAVGRIDRITNKVKKKCYCVLHKASIEELQHDVVGVKGDAATIVLKGQRVPREYRPVDAGEILAKAIEHFSLDGSQREIELEAKWPELRSRIKAALTGW